MGKKKVGAPPAAEIATPSPGLGALRHPVIGESDQAGQSGAEIQQSGLTNADGYVLRRAQVAVCSDFIGRFAAFNLKPAQYSALLEIGDSPGRKQSEIAAALGIKRSNFVVSRAELERRGLAERGRSTTGRRSHAGALTKKGHALLARARAVQDDQECGVAEILGPDGRDTFVTLARRLAELR